MIKDPDWNNRYIPALEALARRFHKDAVAWRDKYYDGRRPSDSVIKCFICDKIWINEYLTADQIQQHGIKHLEEFKLLAFL